MMKKHYVEFYSPGSFMAERSTREIDSWDVEKAREMAKDVEERYGATPYGFRFITRSRGFRDMESKVTKQSGMYYINCKVETVQDLEERNNPKDNILIQNMKNNKWEKIVTTTKGWKWSQPLRPDDVVLG